MATIVNRAAIEVLPRSKAHASLAKKFRSKKQAEAYKAELEAKSIACSFYQEPTGMWEAVVRLKDGVGKTITDSKMFHTEDEARAWANEKEALILDARMQKVSLSVNKTSFKDAVEVWYKNKGSKLAGAKIIAYNKAKLIEHFKPTTPLDEITVPVVRAWRDKMMIDEGYAASTVANYRQILSGTFEYYISELDFRGDNPCRKIEWEKPDNVVAPPTLSSTKLKRKSISEDDFDDGTRDEIVNSDEELLLKTIQKQSGKWLVDIVKFALETAARRSEILRLEWEHIDFDENRLHFIKEKNDWRKDNTEEKGRKIPLWNSLRELLEEIEPDENKRNGKIFKGTLSSCSHSFAEAVKKLGWTDLTFHSLRKIATGRLSKILSNVVELSQITAHADLQTLAKRYYGVDLEHLAKQINRARSVEATEE